MAKRLDRRRVKIHFNYDVTEVAALLGVHKLTVRRWIAAGLQTTDVRRPLLVRGADLSAFLKARQPVKQSCQPGEFFCLSLSGAQTAGRRYGRLRPAHVLSRLAVWYLPDVRKYDVPRGELQRDLSKERRSRRGI